MFLLRDLLAKARGEEKADLILQNGWIVDVFNEKLYQGNLAIAGGVIIGSGDYHGVKEVDLKGQIIAPALIDGHLHLESAMVRVGELARFIIPCGVTTVVADPHEIANVAGVEGINYMLKAGLDLPWNFKMMLPSCVPATSFETAGAELLAEELKTLLAREGIWGLGEMMDFTGVINGESRVWSKLELFEQYFKDGHAPGLTGQRLNTYLLGGIQADHECTDPIEALEKVQKGMYVMIREGSVARDLTKLLSAVTAENNSRFLLATDDRHPEDIVAEGHLDFLVRRAIAEGLTPLRAIKLATINAALALGLKGLGALAPGYQADFIIIDNWQDFNIRQVYHRGRLVAVNNQALFTEKKGEKVASGGIFNSIKPGPFSSVDFELPTGGKYRVMDLIADKLITREGIVQLETAKPDSLRVNNLLKLAVIERHHQSGNIGLGLLRGFGLQAGAIASSISHDSHNIIVAGLQSEDMLLAARKIEELQGGIIIVCNGQVIRSLALPIAGLMSNLTLQEVARTIGEMRKIVYDWGVKARSPFMTLSFMALPVIPELKLTDRGLFDLNSGEFVSLRVE